MSPRSGLVGVLASGAATAARLLAATLAFTGAYVGVEAPGASVGARSTAGAGTPHITTVTLSAQTMPLTTPLKSPEGLTIEPMKAAGPASAGMAKPAESATLPKLSLIPI
ncbi:hypothetical protein, partial [Spongiactinospora gelatinilytica]|uniref:hypothetical protein n=1 Tax=Spongiactinospora gelatinilytica TaxID=2666298 RepID=UPI0018F44DAB